MSYTINLSLNLLSYNTLMSIENDASDQIAKLDKEFMAHALAFAEGKVMSYSDTQAKLQAMREIVDNTMYLKELLSTINNRMKEIASNN